MVGEDMKMRLEQGTRGAWVGIMGNLGLASLKGVVGVMAGSQAMLADALHSAADIMGSLAVLVAMRVANKPADQCHPYGHGKAESLAVAVVAALLLFTGLKVGWDSLQGVLGPPGTAPGVIAFYTACFSLIVKEIMFQYKIRLGEKLQSPALKANAWEHRSDAFSSGAALIGIGGARLGYPVLDPLAGIVVALVVVKIGWEMAFDACSQLMDRIPGEDLSEELKNAAFQVEGVKEVQKVWLRPMGSFLLVDVTIAVPGTLSVEGGHRIAAQVAETIHGQRPEVARVFVHVNPL